MDGNPVNLKSGLVLQAFVSIYDANDRAQTKNYYISQ